MQQQEIHDIIEHMIRTDRKHRAVCDKELSSLAVFRSQQRMLMHLWHHEGGMTQRALADELHIAPSVVTVTLHKLEAEGYVTRIPCPTDKRSYQISLAEKGYGIVNAAHEILDRVDRAMLDGFTRDETEQLVSFYLRMLSNLTKFAEDTE